MVTKRSEREKFKKLPENLAYRSAVDLDKARKKIRKKEHIRRIALARAAKRYDGPVQPGQVWMLFAHETFGMEWVVVKVSAAETVELRGDSGVSWFLGVEELTKLGTLLTASPRGVIHDTIGSRGEDTPEA